jgi:ATP-binding cassette, subfamily B, multidrug efflux pump
LLNWQLALMTFLVIPPLLVLTHFIRLGMRESFRAVRIKLARVNAMIAENISGIPVIQLFNREQKAYRDFDAINRDLLDSHLLGVLFFALFWPLVGVASAMTTAGIIWYGGSQVLDGVLTVGGVVAFLQYVERFFQPIRDLSEKYNIMQQAMASSERIFMILDERPTVRDAGHPHQLSRLKGEIEFRDVWFAYEPGNWVLKGVSFRIAEGEKVAIVGATGAGKTSIISLVSRFYDVQKGAVLVDGLDVRDLPQTQLRQQVGVVLQDPFLFSGTIAHNIRLNEMRITDEQVRDAARYVHADDFIGALPSGYDTPVLERGAGLSVGQKQLIAFARAVAFNPAMLLVLDEATANVDTETEWRIQRALERLMHARTSVIIAHRLSTIRQVDRILVLHKGKLVEEGTHNELLELSGRYARLYELQYRDQEATLLA